VRGEVAVFVSVFVFVFVFVLMYCEREEVWNWELIKGINAMYRYNW